MTLTADELLRDAGAMGKALQGAESTAKATLLVSYIEQALATLLRAFLVSGDTSKEILHHGRGLLRELSARNRLCYCLGLIDRPAFENINTLGDIRNLFAHSHTERGFKDDDISALCMKLTFPRLNVIEVTIDYDGKQVIHGKQSQQQFESEQSPEGRFFWVASLIGAFLVKQVNEIKRRERPETIWTR